MYIHTSKAVSDISGVYALIDSDLVRVKDLILQRLYSHATSDSFSSLLDALNILNGKMLRPALVLISGKLCGQISDNHIRTAAVLEIIHNATLLHDDVLDAGQKRRGRDTVNSLWGNESAVLTGDLLLSRALAISAELPPEAVKIISHAAAQTCRGELTEVLQRQNRQLTESEYFDIIDGKTAALFAASCRLGAALADADHASTNSLASYGRNLGIAFQITDDILDIIGNENETGKTIGTDIDKNKSTLAVIHFLSSADNRQKQNFINSHLKSNSKSDKNILIETLNSSGSLEYAKKTAQNFIDKAIADLDSFRQSPPKEALIATADFVTKRLENCGNSN